jgi:hypothetical protein
LDFSSLATDAVQTGLILYVAVLLGCWWLLLKKRYIILLLWPVIIYLPGPTITSFFEGVPGLTSYIFSNLTLYETLVIFCYFMGLVVADRLLDLSAVIESCLYNPTVRRLSASPFFLPLFFATALLATVLQINILRTYGTVLTGDYAYWASLSDEDSGWGFVAGLYEIVFLLFMVALLGTGLGRTSRFLITAVYLLTALLRLAGGTRLVLVKELALVLILLYLKGSVRKRQLVIVSVVTILGGSLIGLMRSNGNNVDGGALGPLYGIAVESAFNALTFNIAYQVEAAGRIDTLHQIGTTLQFTGITSVPSFLRPGVSQADLDVISPYSAGTASGFDTYSPVGGMSGFATLTYVSGNVMLACWLLVIAIAVLVRFTPKSRWKRLIVLVFVVNGIHFWRDPMDISVKLLVQDMLIVLVLLYIPPLRGLRSLKLVQQEATP